MPRPLPTSVTCRSSLNTPALLIRVCSLQEAQRWRRAGHQAAPRHGCSGGGGSGGGGGGSGGPPRTSPPSVPPGLAAGGLQTGGSVPARPSRSSSRRLWAGCPRGEGGAGIRELCVEGLQAHAAATAPSCANSGTHPRGWPCGSSARAACAAPATCCGRAPAWWRPAAPAVPPCACRCRCTRGTAGRVRVGTERTGQAAVAGQVPATASRHAASSFAIPTNQPLTAAHSVLPVTRTTLPRRSVDVSPAS